MHSRASVATSRRLGCALAVLALGGCAADAPARIGAAAGGYDPKYGVSASPRLVADGRPIPHGGGNFLIGRPYVIAGRAYYPSNRDYHVVGMASWYGDAFHGRRTANGEIFDKNSLVAAHPTMPLPSYARVTNMHNNRSVIVRVNDRGPFEANRVMDVSERVADLLDFKLSGTARVKIDYLGPAGLTGSDDRKLTATLRTDGSAAELARSTDLPSGFLANDDQPPPSDHLAAIPADPDTDAQAASGQSVQAQSPSDATPSRTRPARFRVGSKSNASRLALGYAAGAKPQVLSEGADADPLADASPVPVPRPDTN